jgi:hypothetical protein
VTFPARHTLTAGDRIVVRSIAEAMFSQDGEVTAARLDAHVTDVDGYVSAASPPIRFGLRIALFIVRIAPLLMFFRMRTLERLSVDERVEILARLERSRITNLSLAFIGWRTVMTLVFYEDPIELASIGYAGEERVRHKRSLLVIAPLALAPLAEESGVRLRTDREPDSERAPVAVPDEATSSREVA